MSQTCTVTGTMAYQVSVGGPVVSELIGAPVVTPTVSPVALSFDERASGTLKITAGATQAVNFQSVATGSLVYLGTDAACEVTFNGGSDVFSMDAGAYILMYKTEVTAISIKAGVVAATVQFNILGA